MSNQLSAMNISSSLGLANEYNTDTDSEKETRIKLIEKAEAAYKKVRGQQSNWTKVIHQLSAWKQNPPLEESSHLNKQANWILFSVIHRTTHDQRKAFLDNFTNLNLSPEMKDFCSFKNNHFPLISIKNDDDNLLNSNDKLPEPTIETSPGTANKKKVWDQKSQVRNHLEAAKSAYQKISAHNVFPTDQEKTIATPVYPNTTEKGSRTLQDNQIGEEAISQHQAELSRNITPFETWCSKQELLVTQVSGEDLNCLINAMLQHATGQYSQESFPEATTIRKSIETAHPDQPRMLQEDEERAKLALKEVNRLHNTNIRVIFIQANEQGLPAITSEIGDTNGSPVVIWNQAMHYVCISKLCKNPATELKQVQKKTQEESRKKRKEDLSTKTGVSVTIGNPNVDKTVSSTQTTPTTPVPSQPINLTASTQGTLTETVKNMLDMFLARPQKFIELKQELYQELSRNPKKSECLNKIFEFGKCPTQNIAKIAKLVLESKDTIDANLFLKCAELDLENVDAYQELSKGIDSEQFHLNAKTLMGMKHASKSKEQVLQDTANLLKARKDSGNPIIQKFYTQTRELLNTDWIGTHQENLQNKDTNNEIYQGYLQWKGIVNPQKIKEFIQETNTEYCTTNIEDWMENGKVFEKHIAQNLNNAKQISKDRFNTENISLSSILVGKNYKQLLTKQVANLLKNNSIEIAQTAEKIDPLSTQGEDITFTYMFVPADGIPVGSVYYQFTRNNLKGIKTLWEGIEVILTVSQGKKVIKHCMPL